MDFISLPIDVTIQRPIKLTSSLIAARKNVEATVPLRRQGLSEDCAHTIAFLASDASAYITGANLDINGGMAFS